MMTKIGCRTDHPRILAVAQAFKGSISAAQVADALTRASRVITSNSRTMIGSDGGDGLLDALGGHLARRTQVIASGPLSTPVAGEVGWLDDNTAIVESRLFCGLALLEHSGKSPLHA